MKTLSLIGYHWGTKLDLKLLQKRLGLKWLHADPTELVYREKGDTYLQIHDHGSVVFLNFKNDEQKKWLAKISQTLKVEPSFLKPETYKVEINPKSKYKVLFDKIVLPKLDENIARVLMFSLSQSIALDHYTAQSEGMLEEMAVHIQELEKKGTFSIKGRNLVKYIGRTMSLKNKITSNLYIFDTPNLSWDDEHLNKIHDDLDRELDIDLRYRSLQDNMETVQESLEIFNDFYQHSHSSKLEWIIILLIAFEILKSLYETLF